MGAGFNKTMVKRLKRQGKTESQGFVAESTVFHLSD